MAIITNPILEPLSGFVEDIDENGNHYYRKTDEQTEKEKKDKQLEDLTVENEILKEQLMNQDSVLTSLLEEILPTLMI